jgi:hypothetical protein
VVMTFSCVFQPIGYLFVGLNDADRQHDFAREP